MATDNRGFAYEKKINDLLKKYGLEKKSFRPAASDSNAPDALIIKESKEYKTEIKLDAVGVDFGQGALDYDLKTGKWRLGTTVKTPAADQMREFLTDVGAVELVNKVWGKLGAPRKFTVPLNKFKKKDSDYDQKMFTDQLLRVPGDAISKYYSSKHTYYIQVGNHYGLYYMGKDEGDFGCDEFKPEARLRIRRKRGGSMPLYNYRFSTALQVVSLSKSNMDLENEDDLKALAARMGKRK